MPPKRLKSTSRRDAPVSPPKSASQSGSPTQARRSTRSGSREVQASKVDPVPLELPTVEEEQDAELQDAADGADALDRESVHPSEQTSGSQDTQGELDALDGDLILETLPSLYDHSLRLINIFDVGGYDALDKVIQEIRSGEGAYLRRLNMHLTHYYMDKKTFGGRLYLPVDLTVTKLRGADPENDGPWRPDPIIYLANLALFAVTVLTGDDTATTDHIEHVYATFPSDFASPVHNKFGFSEALRPLTLQVAILLRTQLFIREADKHAKDAHFNPEQLLVEIFMQDERTVRGVDMAGQHASTYIDSVQDAMNDLRQYIANANITAVNVDGLKVAKPWRDMQDLLGQWVLQRKHELELQVQSHGGMTGICNKLRNGDFTSGPLLPPKSKRGRKSKGTPGKAAVDPSDIARLKELKAQNAAQTAVRVRIDPRLTAMEQQAQAQRDEIPESITGEPEGADVDPAEMTSEQQIALVMGALAQQATQANKENQMPGPSAPPRQKSFMDRQSGAIRVTPDPETPHATQRKRGAPDDDENEDDDFEADTRAEKRPRIPHPTQQGQFAQANDWSLDPSDSIADPSGTQATASQPLPPADPNLQLGTFEHHRMAQSRAKQHVAMLKEAVSAERNSYQERKAWTEAETNRLLELIALHGSKWSKMKQDDANPAIFPGGPMLESRGQVSLKDKARNMKMDYLKARMELPEGFGAVSIGARLIKVLRDMGVHYVEGDARGQNLVGGVNAGTGVGGGYAEEE